MRAMSPGEDMIMSAKPPMLLTPPVVTAPVGMPPGVMPLRCSVMIFRCGPRIVRSAPARNARPIDVNTLATDRRILRRVTGIIFGGPVVPEVVAK